MSAQQTYYAYRAGKDHVEEWWHVAARSDDDPDSTCAEFITPPHPDAEAAAKQHAALLNGATVSCPSFDSGGEA